MTTGTRAARAPSRGMARRADLGLCFTPLASDEPLDALLFGQPSIPQIVAALHTRFGLDRCAYNIWPTSRHNLPGRLRQGDLESLQPSRTLHNLLLRVPRNDRWDRVAADVLRVRYDAQRRKQNG